MPSESIGVEVVGMAATEIEKLPMKIPGCPASRWLVVLALADGRKFYRRYVLPSEPEFEVFACFNGDPDFGYGWTEIPRKAA